MAKLDKKMIKQLYTNYQDYLANQLDKTIPVLSNITPKVIKKNEITYNKFLNRNSHLKTIKSNGRILCLGARFGTEVKAFIDMGYDAIGIDLVPCPPYVMRMDFMNMNWDCKFDIIYTNSVDHCFDLVAFVKQIYNNLKDDGLAVIDYIHNKWHTVGNYKSVNIETSEDLLSAFVSNGFVLHSHFNKLPKRYDFKKIKEDQYMFKKGEGYER